MSDAYGSVTFKKSQGCSFNYSALATELNSFEWSNDGAKWLVSRANKNLQLDTSRPQYPVAIPEFEEFIHIQNEDGSWITLAASEATEDDWLDMCSITRSPHPLKVLSQRISPLIRKGWIEITCAASEKSHYAYFQSLRIHSDGRAEKINVWSGSSIEPINEQEIYIPG